MTSILSKPFRIFQKYNRHPRIKPGRNTHTKSNLYGFLNIFLHCIHITTTEMQNRDDDHVSSKARVHLIGL